MKQDLYVVMNCQRLMCRVDSVIFTGDVTPQRRFYFEAVTSEKHLEALVRCEDAAAPELSGVRETGLYPRERWSILTATVNSDRD